MAFDGIAFLLQLRSHNVIFRTLPRPHLLGMKTIITWLAALLLWPSTGLMAQRSDLFLFDFTKIVDGYELSRPRLLSNFNTGGYTNQPSFADPYRLLVSAGPAENPTQTDLFELNLRTESVTRLTKTIDREYSPSSDPNQPDQILCVVVEVENDNNQRLWSYPTSLAEGGHGILASAGQVGYFCPLKSGWIAVFELGTPNKLYMYHRKTRERKFISSNIGRTLKQTKDGSLVFVHKISDSYWFLKRLNVDDFIPEVIKKTIPDAEDFTLLDDNSILMGSGSKLYHLDVNGDVMWRELADLQHLGLGNITRLAHNGINMLAIVSDE